MVEKFFSSFLHCSGGSIRSFVAVTGSYTDLFYHCWYTCLKYFSQKTVGC